MSRFGAIYWVCIVLLVAAVVGLAAALRKFTIEFVHPAPWKLKSHWWRFVLPPAVALIMALSADDFSSSSSSSSSTMSLFGRAVWIFILGVGLPLWLTFSTLQEVLVRRWERILGIVTLLLLINSALLTAQWAKVQREQTSGYQGPARIVDYYNNGAYEQNTMKLQLEWTCSDQGENGSEQYYCHDNVVLDCNTGISQTDLRSDRDYDMTVYNGDSFLGCQDGFDQDTWQKYNWNHWNNNDDDAQAGNNDGEGRRLNEDEGEDENNNSQDEQEGENDNSQDEEEENNSQDEQEDENNGQDEQEEEEENNNEENEEQEDEDENGDENNASYQNYQDQRPYMVIYGNCNTCQVNKHGAGNLYKAARNRLVIPLWVLTSATAAVAGYFYSIRRPTRKEVSAEKTAQLFDNGASHRFDPDEPEQCMA